MPTMSDLRARAKTLGIPAPFGTSKETLEKAVLAAEEAQVAPTASAYVTPSLPAIEVRTIENPDITPAAIMNATIAGNLNASQEEAKIKAEVEAKLRRERIERQLREEAQIAERKQKLLNKHKLTYDIAEMKAEMQAIAQRAGCTFQIDTQADGSLTGTYHMFGSGKQNSGNLAQPLDTIRRDVRIFCKIKIDKDMPTRDDMVRSQFTGQPIATPVHIVGQHSADDTTGDIAASQ